MSTPAPGSRAIAANALRNAGLIDRDATMRDVSDKPGGRKGTSKIRSHRPRPIDALTGKDQASSSRLLASRLSHAGPSDPLSIRGAARPTTVGRVRRNALSTGSSGGSSSSGGIAVKVAQRTKVVDQWREFVKSRWNPEARFLNLESMLDDAIVKKYNLTPPGLGGGSARDAAVIFKLASELKPEVQTLSLANNKLSGTHLSYLSKYLPKLANLSLQGNNLRTWKDLEYISARKDKLVHLRELILLGNPVRDLEFKNGRAEKYKIEMLRRFTALEVLDQEAITQISFDVPQPSSAPVQKPNATTFPCEMGPSFITGVDGALVSNFLVRFFNTFDTSRSLLVSAYDPSATFSFSANTQIPARARIEGLHSSPAYPNQRKLEWGPWLNGGQGGSRNLSRISLGMEKMVKSLHVGSEEAMKAMLDLPGTRHDISGPPEKFVLDAFPVPLGTQTGLMIIVHGQFTEVPSEGIRSFDRTFILAPAPEGSRAKQEGWEVMILSDQWVIRGLSSHEAWRPGPMLVQAEPQSKVSRQAPRQQQAAFNLSQLPAEQHSMLASLPEVQRNLVLQVIPRTGLNVKFSVDCLTGNGWDLERAIANFNEVKTTLGGDAFL
ncbi:hypothetical protein BDQ17DRAFT_1422910 [Cyathus striatus]|nr:hypothetical protein BDQ17DRAFT_1422910 [Cyathus striatus]